MGVVVVRRPKFVIGGYTESDGGVVPRVDSRRDEPFSYLSSTLRRACERLPDLFTGLFQSRESFRPYKLILALLDAHPVAVFIAIDCELEGFHCHYLSPEITFRDS